MAYKAILTMKSTTWTIGYDPCFGSGPGDLTYGNPAHMIPATFVNEQHARAACSIFTIIGEVTLVLVS